MIAISPSKNVIAPIIASMIAAKPIQPVHAEDMSRRVSIVLMQRSFQAARPYRAVRPIDRTSVHPFGIGADLPRFQGPTSS
jgi:hypothetical protein